MKRLDNHQTIALDFDQTLVQNPNSPLLWDHIKKNLHKKYWIVTFRCYHLCDEDRLRAEFEMFSGISSTIFQGVKFVPAELYDARGLLFKEWKGKIASELGCTLLIDDIPEWVEEGANKYGVEYINPYNLASEIIEKAATSHK